MCGGSTPGNRLMSGPGELQRWVRPRVRARRQDARHRRGRRGGRVGLAIAQEDPLALERRHAWLAWPFSRGRERASPRRERIGKRRSGTPRPVGSSLAWSCRTPSRASRSAPTAPSWRPATRAGSSASSPSGSTTSCASPVSGYRDTPTPSGHVSSESGRLFGAAGGLPGHDRRGGPAAERVPAARRRGPDRRLHARPHRWELPTPSARSRTATRRRRPGRTRSPATGSRSPSGPTPGAPGTESRPYGGRTAPSLRLSDVRSEDPATLRAAVRAPLGPGRFRVESLDDRRGRDERLTRHAGLPFG